MRNSLTRALSATTLALLVAAGTAHADWEAGLAAFKAGDLATATNEFQALVDQQPDWYGGHFMLGQTLLKQDRNQEALNHLRKAYDLNPNDVAVQLPLGKAYLAVGRYGDAAALLGALDDSSLSAAQKGAVQQMLALAYGKTGQSDQAFSSLARAAQASPDDAAVQYQYGSAALNAGDTATAVRALERAASLDPRDTRKQRGYIQALLRSGRENRGSAKAQAYAKAVTAGQKLVQSDSSYDNLLLLGEAQLGATRYEEAAATFRQAAGKNSQDWLPHFYIGQAYTATGAYDQAEDALQQAIDRTSTADNQRRIWKQLGFVFEKQKEFTQARNAYQQAGDQASVQRVEENQRIEEYNEEVSAEAEKIRQIEAERKRLEEELKELPGGPPPLD